MTVLIDINRPQGLLIIKAIKYYNSKHVKNYSLAKLEKVIDKAIRS